MTRTNSPLDGVDRLLVDGTNLLHALAREARTGPAGGPAPLPPAALIGRLRAAIPPAVAIELVFDGPPDPGMRGARIASGVLVRYGGRRSADDLIVALVDEARTATADARGADNILVVTDDRDLRTSIRARGAGTAGGAWLAGRLGRTRLEAPTTGNRRPPVGVDRDGRTSAEPSRPGWRPGRGATTKHGNPKRSPRGGRLRQD